MILAVILCGCVILIVFTMPTKVIMAMMLLLAWPFMVSSVMKGGEETRSPPGYMTWVQVVVPESLWTSGFLGSPSGES